MAIRETNRNEYGRNPTVVRVATYGGTGAVKPLPGFQSYGRGKACEFTLRIRRQDGTVKLYKLSKA